MNADKFDQKAETDKHPDAGVKLEPFRMPDFDIRVPHDWTDRVICMLSGPVSGGSLPVVHIYCDRETAYKSLEEYAEKELKDLEAVYPGYKQIRRNKMNLAGKFDAEEALYQWTGGGDNNMFQRKILTLVGETAFALVGTFVGESRKGENILVDSILQSFTPVISK